MIGSIVLSTNQGLGVLAKQFYDNGLIDKVLVRRHSSRENFPERFKEWKWLEKENFDWLLEGIDTLLCFEEVWEWKIIDIARSRGIKVVFMPMYECTRQPFPYEPDLILCPSELDYEYYKDKNAKIVRIPVDTKWKLRTKALKFVHNAGNGGLGGRNGTKELIEAMAWVKSPIELIIRTQEKNFTTNDPRIKIISGTIPYEELFNDGDVFIFPEKFNGLSLPLQEAYASGMLVMATDRFPMNTWLPKEPLIPVKSYIKERIAVEFDYAVIDPKDIAKMIDNWYDKDITQYSLMGKQWGEKNSWKNLKQSYIDLCEK